MEKIFLGISLGFNSSASVVSSERGVLAAASEERFIDIKNTKRTPIDAIKACIAISKVSYIDQIIICHYEDISMEYFKIKDPDVANKYDTWEDIFIDTVSSICELKNTEIVRINHHDAHAFSSYGFYHYNDEPHYTITSDGFGDGLSAKICFDGKTISEVPLTSSIALIYQFTTGALGFKEHQHEGKITGLAAFGQPKYMLEFESLFDTIDSGNGLRFRREIYNLTDEQVEQVKTSHIHDFEGFLLLKTAVYNLITFLKDKGATREDIAATVQEFAEKHTIKWLSKYCITKADAYIAGGLFANVKINQRLKDSRLFTNVYVCPAMGDEGTCVGAPLYYMYNKYNIKPIFTDLESRKVISGTDLNITDKIYSNIQDILVGNAEVSGVSGIEGKYSYRRVHNEDERVEIIADRLAKNKIVCLMQGRMEFGPRALCHRSILYNATDKSTNDSLNARLSRSEFMPFAPVCRDVDAESLFKNIPGGDTSFKFMTMTFDGTDEFVNTYKAVAHIDGTARPQVVTNEDDSYMYKILSSYYNKTNLKCLVNTSFNLHEHPIVRDYTEGLYSFIKADLDVLVIDDVVIEKIC